MESECILNVRTIGFLDRLDLEYGGKKGIEEDSRFFACSNSNEGVAFNLGEKEQSICEIGFEEKIKSLLFGHV